MKKPLVVNMFAAPGSGKSTTAAGLFHELKSIGINAELATEFAKDAAWADRHKVFQDQFYIFGKQHHRLHILKDDVDVIITDAPLFLGVIYAEDNYPYCFKQTVSWAFNQFNNLNFLLKRTKKFNPKGRHQTEAESDALQEVIRSTLDEYEVPYFVTEGNKVGLEIIYKKVIASLT